MNMRFLEKIGLLLFMHSMKRRLVSLQKFENIYKDTPFKQFMLIPLHQAYTKMSYQIKALNSKHFKFNTLIKYVQYKIQYIEDLNNAR